MRVRIEQRPLDERLAGQLMLALYRSGSAGGRARHYHQTRRQLARNSASSPSRRYANCTSRSSPTTPAIAGPHPARAPKPARPVPRQLPAAPRAFTGRDAELDGLTARLDAAKATVPISVIAGAGGIGKTWLALHWAHRNLHRFPDGQLFVNLRGFDPTGEPMPLSDAVRGFLDALGVEPAGDPGRAGRADRAVPEPGRGPADADPDRQRGGRQRR